MTVAVDRSAARGLWLFRARRRLALLCECLRDQGRPATALYADTRVTCVSLRLERTATAPGVPPDASVT